MRILAVLSLAVVFAFAPARAQQTRIVNETEPNNTKETAQAVAMGDSLIGSVSGSDLDYFYIDLAANQQLHIGAAPGAELWVSAMTNDGIGAAFWPQHRDEQERNLWYKSSTAARYYIMVSTPSSSTVTTYRLGVNSAPVPQGPGDPTTNFASVTRFAGMVAGNNVLYVATGNIATGQRVLRIEANGHQSTIATLQSGQGPFNGGIALDGSGNILALTQTIIWRITPGGTLTEFARTIHNSPAISVGPDGDVWVGTFGKIRRFDAQGALKSEIAAFKPGTFGSECTEITYLAFSPAGELHYAADHCAGLFKLINNNTAPSQVMGFSVEIEGPAFDRDGYLYLVDGMYLTNGGNSKVVLFDPTYSRVKDPFSTDIWTDWYLHQLVFWRDASGNPTNRLFAIANGRIVELNRSGIRAPGWPVGKQGGGQTVAVTAAQITTALMGGASLTADQVQFVDSQGNKNGVLDIGDLRAYLRAQGQLAGSQRP